MDIPSGLGDLQLAVLRVLWQKEEASIAEVHETLKADRKIAFTTVATVLSRLEKVHGIIGHRSEGRTYIYKAWVNEEDVQASMLNDVMGKVFDGSALSLVSHLLSSDAVNEDELERVKALIAEYEKSG